MDDNKKIEQLQKAMGLFANNKDIDIVDVICYLKGWLPMQKSGEITISSPDKKSNTKLKE